MEKNKIRLGVNIDHIATIRTNRNTDYPSLIEAVNIAEQNGADLITVHLREDRRHIQDQDLFDIRPIAKTLNLEMALTNEMIDICMAAKPDYCCIVPEKREELTTEGGLDIIGMSSDQFNLLSNSIDKFQNNKIKVSLFIDPDISQIDYAIKSGAKCIELHTGSYANAMNSDIENKELNRIKVAAQFASESKLQVHAGHGLNLSNLSDICKIPEIEELNIGHAIIADSIFKGFKQAVNDFRSAIDNG
jgi:pyridoxine 5-phosphate synthase